MNNEPDISDISDNIITDLSNNINANDTLTNILQNIYQEAIDRTNRHPETPYENLLNNPNRLRFLFNNDNSLNNVFNDINPLLLNADQDENIFNLNDIFSNLINNTLHSQTNWNNVLNNSFNNDRSNYKHVLSEKGKTQLNKCLFKDSSKTNNSCPILYEEFSSEDEIIELPCKHCFVPEAIEKWLIEEQAMCPVCRFKLDSKEVKIKKNRDSNNNRINNNTDSDDEYDVVDDIDSDDEYERFMQLAILESMRD